MNKLFIIGNLTRDPELRTTSGGLPVCSFTVAVNRRKSSDAQAVEADFFRVTAWRQLAEICAKYLAKGRKVSVVGAVAANTYTGNDGQTRASLEVTADDVEFLTPRNEAGESNTPLWDHMKQQAAKPAELPRSDTNGYMPVDEELSF